MSKSKPDWLEFAEQHTHDKVTKGHGRKKTVKLVPNFFKKRLDAAVLDREHNGVLGHVKL